jgi:hypothetical protein
MTEYSEEEKHICDLQRRFAARLRRSPYYVTQVTKSTGTFTLSLLGIII